MWYVNYKSFRFAMLIIFSFILTMWYVNMEFVPEYVADIGGFILTMWYVNNAFYELGYRFALVLY